MAEKYMICCRPSFVLGILALSSLFVIFTFLEKSSVSWHVLPKVIRLVENLNVSHVITNTKVNQTTPIGQLNPKAKQACVHSPLDVDDPIMMKFYRKVERTVCPGKNWVYVDNGTLRFFSEAVEVPKSISCDYIALVRINEWKNRYAVPIKNISFPFPIQHDQFKIVCNGSNGEAYENFHQGVAFRQSYVDRPQDPLEKGFEGLGVAILGFDSMSRMSWLRRLPVTRKYFVEQLGAIELEQHNILGDGTVWVLFPMLTGKFERELPECRLSHHAKPMDNFTWIWHDFKRAGYLTAWNNAQPHGSPLNWKNSGFGEKPTDFYTRTFYNSAFQKIRKWCLGSQSRHDLWLNWFRDVFHMYKKQRKFLFHFITEMSHNDNNLLTEMDERIQKLVQHLHDDGFLNNTLLIMMGDHGARYGEVRTTIPGKLEERQPYFSFLFPPWFLKKHPDAIQNLKTNTKRLTTPFDIHATFKEFFNYTGAGKGSVKKRGISLFKEIPLERTCKHASITSHWCACLDWKKVNISDTGVQEALKTAMDTINSFTHDYRSDCALLSVANVTMASKREMTKSFLTIKKKYETSKDGNKALYQITFYTTPGDGQYEVTVTHNVKKNKYISSKKEISRLNKYGDAPHCIVNKNRRIQPYCYCKDLIKS